jgi:hypothetical protein
MGQAAGRGKLADLHSSPDYVAGVVHFKNGVRGIYDCGAGAPDVPEVDASREQRLWWRKARMGAQGTEGFAEVITNGGWRAVTRRDGYLGGPGKMDYVQDMPPYIQEMADWLDDDKRIHECAFANAYKGFEIMCGAVSLCCGQAGRAAADRRQDEIQGSTPASRTTGSE